MSVSRETSAEKKVSEQKLKLKNHLKLLSDKEKGACHCFAL